MRGFYTFLSTNDPATVHPPPPHIFSVGVFFSFPQIKKLVMHKRDFGIYLVFSGNYCGGPSVNIAILVKLPQIHLLPNKNLKRLQNPFPPQSNGLAACQKRPFIC